MNDDLRSVLRARTRTAHAALDTALAPDGRVGDTADYVRLLRTLHALHAATDAPLAAWAARRGLSWAPPRRAHLYAEDLRALGEPVGVEVAPAEPLEEGRALGLLYLVTGSSAGARVLLRGLSPEVHLGAVRGLSDAAAPAASRAWRATLHLLSARHEDAVVEAAVDAASGGLARLAVVEVAR